MSHNHAAVSFNIIAGLATAANSQKSVESIEPDIAENRSSIYTEQHALANENRDLRLGRSNQIKSK
jgi:hypothetical protein